MLIALFAEAAAGTYTGMTDPRLRSDLTDLLGRWDRCVKGQPAECAAVGRATTYMCFESAKYKEGAACFLLGRLGHSGLDPAYDRDTAVRAWAEGCGMGNASSCSELGIGYLLPFEVYLPLAADRSKATALFQKACTLDGGDGCRYLGQVQREKEPEAALRSFTRGCDLGVGGSCRELGELFESGTVGSADMVKAADAYRRGCDAADGPACTRLGRAASAGGLEAGNIDPILQLFTKACDLGDADGCSATAYIHGQVRFDFDQQLMAARRRVALLPDNPNAQADLAEALIEGGRSAEARGVLDGVEQSIAEENAWVVPLLRIVAGGSPVEHGARLVSTLGDADVSGTFQWGALEHYLGLHPDALAMAVVSAVREPPSPQRLAHLQAAVAARR